MKLTFVYLIVIFGFNVSSENNTNENIALVLLQRLLGEVDRMKENMKEMKETINFQGTLIERKDEIISSLQQSVNNLDKKLNEQTAIIKGPPNVCILEKVVCGQCQCKADERLLKGYYCDCRYHQPMKDCASFKAAGYQTSGVYVINMTSKPLLVFCDQENDGGGWILFQRRLDGTINFYRNWRAYKGGFGVVQHEHWLGNDNIHQLTASNKMELRIDTVYFDGLWKRLYAKYGQFRVEDENSLYKLHLGQYSGNNGDEMAYHNGRSFSTYDGDHDGISKINCAAQYKGGWWYKTCHHVNLNGRYYFFNESLPYASGIHWYAYDNFKKSMMGVEMKMRLKRQLKVGYGSPEK